MSTVIGIDLGTTNSCVAIVEDGNPVVIPNSEGSRTTPSIVAFTDSEEWLVGQVAKRQAVTNPQNTVYAAKRLMGRRYDSPETRSAITAVPYDIVESKNGDACIGFGERKVTPPEISAHILRKLRESAEDYLGIRVSDAILTVPAYFNDSQRQATKDAGRIAGLNILRIINEPTAAALAYGLLDEAARKVAVYDLGGGTFDISILSVGDGLVDVLSTNGDTFLGGEDFDQRIIEWLHDLYSQEHGESLREDRLAIQRLKEAAEKAKCDLSSMEETVIELPFIAADQLGPKHLSAQLTRVKLEELVGDLVSRTIETCSSALRDAGLQGGDIDEVLLVGGQTRMPLVKQSVASFFNLAPSEIMNPDEVVAMGAAIQGGVLRGEVADVLLIDVTPLSLGVETQGGVFTKLIERNSKIPATSTQVFSTTVDNQSLVTIHVLQGERPLADDNHSLARFDLVGIPPAPRGVPQIEVIFSIDANGLASVTATELGTGKKQSVAVTATGGLDEVEIERLIEVADNQSASDRARKALVDLRNRAKGLIYTTERSLVEYAEFVGPEALDVLQEELAHCSQMVEYPDATEEDLQDAIGSLEEAAHQLADILYQEMAFDEGDEGYEDEEGYATDVEGGENDGA